MSDSLHEKVNEIIRQLLGYTGIACDISVTNDPEGRLTVAVQTAEDAKILIGKNGQNLQALEHIVRAMLARHDGGRILSVDINDYRQSRMRELVELVKATAGRVRDSRKSEALPPMTAYERRIVHTELASWSELATESVGQDPQRRVVIKLL